MSREKLVLFDLGNVVIKQIHTEWFYNEFKSGLTLEEFREIWLNGRTKWEFEMGLIDDTSFAVRFLSEIKSRLTKEELIEAYAGYENRLFQDTFDVIDEIKSRGIKVGILSNLAPFDYIGICKYNIQEKFDYKFLSFRLELMKPDPAIYKEIKLRSDAAPEDIYFFDDLIENVEGAKNAGINAYQATGYNIKEVFNSIKDKIFEE